jgi:hypothetical protein
VIQRVALVTISLQGLQRIFYLVSSLLSIIFLLVFALPARLPLRKARTHKQNKPKETHSYCHRVAKKIGHCQFLNS